MVGGCGVIVFLWAVVAFKSHDHRKYLKRVIISPTEGDGRLCFRRRRYVYMFVNNFLASIQFQLSPNFVSHTHGHRGRGD